MIFRLCGLWEGWEVAKASVKTTDLFNSTDQRVLLEFFRNFSVALFGEKQTMQYDDPSGLRVLSSKNKKWIHRKVANTHIHNITHAGFFRSSMKG